MRAANRATYFLTILFASSTGAGCDASVSGAPGQPNSGDPAGSPPGTTDPAPSDDDLPLPSGGDQGAVIPVTRFAVSHDDLPLVGPFTTWANVKTDYGAHGNGTADDTNAIQAALDDIGSSGHPYVVYFPAGTYRITATLRYDAREWYNGAQLIGDDPSSTIIRWSGAAGGTMLVVNGGVNTRFSRFTWDGSGTAGIGVAHWWNANTNPDFYGGSVEHTDEVFVDLDIGIMGGRMGDAYGNLDSEGQIRRVTFVRNHQAGLDVGSWNALDWWIWDSHFIDCARGATNLFSPGDSGAGAFHIYRSLFERSTVADIHIANTQWFGIHENVSIGSRRFFQADQIGANGASTILQGNRIIDPTESAAIVSGNLGQMILVDNTVRSLAGASGPVVRMEDATDGSDLLSIANTFTVDDPLAIATPTSSAPSGGGTSRAVSMDDRKVQRDAIAGAAPSLPDTPAWHAEQDVFEVLVGASATAIQAVIDTAAASHAAMPVVHFAPGTYRLDRTLSVPARSPVQLTGDGLGVVLDCGGCAADTPLLRLEGPSYATIRDLKMFFGAGPAITITDADQVGGRVLIVGSTLGGLEADGLQETALELQSNPLIAALTLSDVRSAVLVGTGGLGPARIDRSNVFISDSWYEGIDGALFRSSDSVLTYLGGHMAPADPVHTGQGSSEAAIYLDGFSGTAAFIGATLNLAGISGGIGIRVANETSDTRALFICQSMNTEYFERTSSEGEVGFYLSKGRTNAGIISLPNEGSERAEFILQSFAQARSLDWQASFSPAADVTTVTIYRVAAVDSGPLAISISR